MQPKLYSSLLDVFFSLSFLPTTHTIWPVFICKKNQSEGFKYSNFNPFSLLLAFFWLNLWWSMMSNRGGGGSAAKSAARQRSLSLCPWTWYRLYLVSTATQFHYAFLIVTSCENGWTYVVCGTNHESWKRRKKMKHKKTFLLLLVTSFYEFKVCLMEAVKMKV